jgi:membrane protease YdiL (CAAX protease family)
MRWLALLLGLGLLFDSLVFGALRVRTLLRAELEYEGPWQSLAERAHAKGATRVSARLAEVALRAGEDATFEVCAQSDLALPVWQGALDFVVWRAAEQKLELKVALDAAHRNLVKRAQDRSCLPLGGGRIAVSGRYALDAVWPSGVLAPALARVPLRARILGKQPLGLYEGLLVVGAALGAVLMLLAGFGGAKPAPQQGAARRETQPRAALWALAFGLLGIIMFQALQRIPLPFLGSGVGRGLTVGALEVSLAVLGARLAFVELRPGLSLLAPALRPTAWLLSTAAFALLLRVISHFCLSLVPRTGEAPIETYIAWPSGALSFALVGMAAPLAEELFFRGFVFGALRRLGLLAAFLGSFGLFVLAHVQQVWGSWGALVSLILTAATLTALRALSGSTLVPALAHVLFNLSLWSASFRG